MPFDVSAPFKAMAVTSASLTHLCFLCHFAPGLPSLLPKILLRLKRNLPLTLSKVCPRVFGKRLILKAANSLSEKEKKILLLMWFQAEIFFKVFSVFDLNRIPGISNI